MIFVYGGAYQGKLDFVKGKYNIKDSNIQFCQESTELDFSKKVFVNLNNFVRACVKNNLEAREILEKSKDLWADSIFVMTEISSGIVPMDSFERAYREAVGRTSIYLGKNAESVVRLFCGIPQILK